MMKQIHHVMNAGLRKKMTTKTELLRALNLTLDTELSLIKKDAIKADENNDTDTMRIILSYTKGLQRGFEICSFLVKQIEPERIVQ